jgi:predicted GIY-YIG superfamily endonuclease
MVNYQLGKIYKIVDNTNGNIYIGSTCEPTLARRLSQHMCDFKRYLNKKRNFTTSFKIIENNNYNIILLETYPSNSKDELHAKDRYYIENNNCVNKQIPTRTSK